MSEATKRGRGRPKKTDAPAEKKPELAEESAESDHAEDSDAGGDAEPVAKKGRGRAPAAAPKETEAVPDSPKKGRGRPKAASESKPAAKKAPSGKGRGRPPKSSKGRGRPKKVASAPESSDD